MAPYNEDWRDGVGSVVESYLSQMVGFGIGQPVGLPPGLMPFVPFRPRSRKMGEDPTAYISDTGLDLLRDISRQICRQNEYATGALENRVSFIVGKGFNYRVRSKHDGLEDARAAIQETVDEFIANSLWGEVEQELVRRCDEDGEAFLRFYPQEDGKTLIRFVEPEFVRTPPEHAGDPEFTFGVQTPPGDVAGPAIAYWIDGEPVDARYIMHIKSNTRSSVKRGLPIFYAVTENLTRAEQTLASFARMTELVASFAILRKHKMASADAVRTFRQGLEVVNTTNAYSGVQRSYQDTSGGIVDVSAQTDYEFPGSQVNVAGYVQTLQAELRAIGSCLTMPEYMISGDASNANYASTMVSESPSVRRFQREQARLILRFAEGRGTNMSVMNRVITHANNCGAYERFGVPSNILQSFYVVATPPSLVVRDSLKESQRYQILLNAGVITVDEWRQKEDL